MSERRCPACGGPDGREFFAMPPVPVLCNVFHEDPAAARAVPRGEVRLAVCPDCGMLWNAAFDPDLLAYGPDYDASLHHSAHFRAFAADLADGLVARHGLVGATVVEIGCGKGEFLRLLAGRGARRCVGFDASYDGAQDGVDGVEVHARFYDRDRDGALGADLLVCRHVLEHLPAPGPFLDSILVATTAPGRGPPRHGAVYLEVPDAMFTLRDGGVWDLIYEHCSYFTAPALVALARRHGVMATAVETGYGGQFLALHGVAGRVTEGQAHVDATPTAAEVARCADRFAATFRATVARWGVALRSQLDRGHRVALWGAGSKGVTFLNVVPGGAQISAVIDLNPHKHGRHIAGTAQRISGPDALRGAGDVDLVLVMNPNYRAEVEAELRARGSRAAVLVAS